MHANFVRQTIAAFTLLVPLLTGCTSTSSEAFGSSGTAGSHRLERSEVSQLIVRYDEDAPSATAAGRPWGAQCVARNYRNSLANGHWIGARMRVIFIDPPTTATVARVIALQMQQCSFIEWAEADVIRFTVP